MLGGLLAGRKYSCFTIELRQVFFSMKVFQGKNISSLFKITIITEILTVKN